MYERFGYYDTWCLEAKHKKYKSMLADTLQHLFKPADGQVSLQVCARVFHMTIQDHLQLPQLSPALAGKVHSEADVLALTGVPSCTVSTSCQRGRSVYKSDDVLLWTSASGEKHAGKVEFFAQHEHLVMVYEAMLPLSSDTSALIAKYRLSGCRRSLLFSSMLDVTMPTWWLFEEGAALCLL